MKLGRQTATILDMNDEVIGDLIGHQRTLYQKKGFFFISKTIKCHKLYTSNINMFFSLFWRSRFSDNTSSAAAPPPPPLMSTPSVPSTKSAQMPTNFSQPPPNYSKPPPNYHTAVPQPTQAYQATQQVILFYDQHIIAICLHCHLILNPSAIIILSLITYFLGYYHHRNHKQKSY